MTYSMKYLRPSEATLNGEGAGGTDLWLVNTGPGASRDEVLAWFLAQPGAPVPGRSMAELNGDFTLCETVSAAMHAKSRSHWLVTCTYAPFDTGGGSSPGGTAPTGAPVNITSPGPLGSTPSGPIQPDDPDSWDPVVARTALGRYMPMATAYYMGGFKDYSDNWCKSKTNIPTKKKCPVVNSALVALQGDYQVPIGGSRVSIRVVKKTPAYYYAAVALENTTPSADISFTHKGLTFHFKRHQAICTSVTISEVQIAKQHAWAIEVQIETGSQVIEHYDHGYEERALQAAGDRQNVEPYNVINNPLSRVQTARENDGVLARSPVPLDGNGKKLVDDADPVFGKWLYLEDEPWGPLFTPF